MPPPANPGGRRCAARGEMDSSRASVDGVINLHKLPGITSAKAVYRVRAITRIRKSGHAGTLDPGAEGVLLVCQGKATKLVERLMDLPKVYRATARLDVTSESFDSDRPLHDVPVASPPSVEQIRSALTTFEGRIDQIPPRISAIKLGGIRAYKTAGDADAPDMPVRKATIYWIHLHDYTWPTLDFEVACGRGTYIRALIRDLGYRLDTGGCLTSLKRTAVGPFTIDDAWTFEALNATAPECPFLLPLPQARELVQRRPVVMPNRPWG